jgi:hypothetical protein
MSAAITAAAIGTAGAVYSANEASKSAKTGSKSKVSPWLEQGSRFAVNRAEQIANRAYKPFSGQRVAGLSSNELQAQRLASAFGDRTRQQMQSGFSPDALKPYQNTYIDQVLSNQNRVIGEEFGRRFALYSRPLSPIVSVGARGRT